jgi:5-deoxy-glucuronate isomerase
MNEPKDWNYSSPDSLGFHTVISPANSICKQTYIFRLNLLTGQQHLLSDNNLELNGVVIEGNVEISFQNKITRLYKCDSFYLPAGNELIIKAKNNCIIFLGGGQYEGIGEFFTRKYDLNCQDKNVRQVHGKLPYRRDVFFTVSQFDSASRLLCGITVGDNALWTSWPPHEHTKDLEEVYCYFNLPKPKFALHLCSRRKGCIEFVHPVSTGNCVIVPEGYHPTVAMPGAKSTYFWVMVAHRIESRRNDLAVSDPNFVGE